MSPMVRLGRVALVEITLPGRQLEQPTSPPAFPYLRSLANVITARAQMHRQLLLGIEYSPLNCADPGITVNNVAASNATTLTAQFVIDAAAAPGPRSIVVTTGAEQAVLPNGFKIPEVSPVNIQNFLFVPDPDTVAAGTFVSWTNQDATTHRIVSDTAGAFD